MEDGDIYHWHYKNDADYLSYWCCSRIGVVRNGMLVDTFWHGSDNKSWPIEEALEKLELTYIGNFNDLEKAPEWYADYYDAADCINLNHSNSTSGNFYIRKGAKRSAEKIRASINAKIEERKRDIKSAEWAIECAGKELAKLDNGEPLESIFI